MEQLEERRKLTEYRLDKMEETLEQIAKSNLEMSKQITELTMATKEISSFSNRVSELEKKLIDMQLAPLKEHKGRFNAILDGIVKAALLAGLGYIVTNIAGI